jgi:hypothetical protein
MIERYKGERRSERSGGSAKRKRRKLRNVLTKSRKAGVKGERYSEVIQAGRMENKCPA